MPPRRFRGLRASTLADGTEAFVASSPLVRLLGLALLDELPPDCALLLPRCRCVHTFGMRFALDIAFLDADGRALRRFEAVGPRRVLRCGGAVAVLERPAARPVRQPAR